MNRYLAAIIITTFMASVLATEWFGLVGRIRAHRSARSGEMGIKVCPKQGKQYYTSSEWKTPAENGILIINPQEELPSPTAAEYTQLCNHLQ